ARDLRGPDVVGDVACELLRREPQASVGGWKSIAGMVAKQDEACIGAPRQDAIAVVFLGADGWRKRSVVRHGVDYSSLPCTPQRDANPVAPWAPRCKARPWHVAPHAHILVRPAPHLPSSARRGSDGVGLRMVLTLAEVATTNGRSTSLGQT